MITFGSVCSGIEAASVAWLPLGWRCAFVSEIDAFPRAVLAHHYPDVPLHGDFTTIEAGRYGAIDLLVGGTPCQSFSVAGLRGGMADARGNLALEYLRLADRLRPRWLVWENVPGVLSSNKGRDFGSFLGGLGALGYGWAYRCLDAQYFGVAQRRDRVFVVGHLGNWRRAAAVLFEPASLRGDPAPRRQARESVAPTLAARTRGGGGLGTDFDLDGGLVSAGSVALRGRDGGATAELGEDVALTVRSSAGGGDKPYALLAFGGNNTAGALDVATAVNAHGGPCGRQDFESETFLVASTLRARDGARGVDSDCTDTLIAHALRAEGFDASEDGTGRGTPLVPVLPFDTTQITSATNRSRPESGDPCHPLAAGAHPPAIAFQSTQDGDAGNDLSLTLRRHDPMAVAVPASAVRRLTPRECERLQGFPDDYTLVPYRGALAKDGPRYKALGNSMAVPVMAWIGRRIVAQEVA